MNRAVRGSFNAEFPPAGFAYMVFVIFVFTAVRVDAQLEFIQVLTGSFDLETETVRWISVFPVPAAFARTRFNKIRQGDSHLYRRVQWEREQCLTGPRQRVKIDVFRFDPVIAFFILEERLQHVL